MASEIKWPIEYADQLIIGNRNSNVAVCTLWSKKEMAAQQLNPSQYAAIGNLYSRAGINSMLRNLLANPKVRFLVVTGTSLTDSKQALYHFFEDGVDLDWRIVGNGAQLERTFPLDKLNEVRRCVQLIDASDGNLAVKLPAGQFEPYAEPSVFERSVPEAPNYTSEFCGFVVREPTIVKVWTSAIQHVMRFGQVEQTDYGIEQRELLNLVTVTENPNSTITELPSWAPFSYAEVEEYVLRFFASSGGESSAYTYGERIQVHWSKDQWIAMSEELRRSAFSRRAVASLWDPITDPGSKNPPCLITLQGTVRQGALFLTAYIRSNDIFRAYPLNAAALAQAQVRLGEELKVRVGSLTILSHSAHIYADCWSQCLEIVDARSHAFVQDPRGSFVFRAASGQLIADHYSPSGDLLQTFSARDKRSMFRQLAPFISRSDHALYLGAELQRLELAIQNDVLYVQDEAP